MSRVTMCSCEPPISFSTKVIVLLLCAIIVVRVVWHG